MGKGDHKSRRGKIWRGTYGNRRPHKVQPAVKQQPPGSGKARKKTK